MPRNIFPQTDRVKEIIQTLMDPASKVKIRLKQSGLMEKVPMIILYCEDWPSFDEYRHQPRSVARCIALAETLKNTIEGFQTVKKSAKKRMESAERSIATKIDKISKITGMPFNDLPLDIQKKALFLKNDGELSDILKEYWAESEVVEDATYRRAHLLREECPDEEWKRKHPEEWNERFPNTNTEGSGEKQKPTKPKEKAFADFCRDMATLFREKSFRPDYRLIADISNLFELSKKPQTYDSIRKRFSRDHI
jgi:hypothetical protein